MGGGKETPRQKMIGLMYLVLMAMLAMNVSKEIINAFVTLNSKFERNSSLTLNNNEDIYGVFGKQIASLRAQKAPQAELDKIEELQSKALKVRNWSRLLANFYVSEAAAMINQSDPEAQNPFYNKFGPEGQEYYGLAEMMDLKKKDDYDTPTRLFVGGDFSNIESRGKALVDSLTGFRNRICQFIGNWTDERGQTYAFDPAQIEEPKNVEDTAYLLALEEQLKTVKETERAAVKQIWKLLTVPLEVENHGKKYPWIAGQFDHAPLVAAACVFTSLKGDVFQAEALASNVIAGRSKVETFNFNKIEPLAFASTGYINSGDSLKLSVMIAAYDSTEKMKLRYRVDDTSGKEDPVAFEGQAGQKLVLSGSPGEHYVTGEIAVREKGQEKWKPWQFKYSVGEPNAAVSPADLLVLYRGWKNKIKVSAAGYDPSKVKVSCKGCKISSKPDKGGNYIATVSGSGKKATIKVSAQDDKGKNVDVASEEFRIFPLPTPKPYMANQSYDRTVIKAAELKRATKLLAKLDNSPLNVKYDVVSFEMLVVKNGKVITMKTKGEKLSGEMKKAIKKLKKGGRVTFQNIAAKGPGGKPKKLAPLVWKLI